MAVASARAKREAEAARKAAEQAAVKAAKWRTWKTADEKPTVEANFIKFALGH